MSKSILIRNSSGTTRTVNDVSHIIIDLKNGGKSTWIPLDEVESLGTVKMTYQNGSYVPIILVPDADNVYY